MTTTSFPAFRATAASVLTGVLVAVHTGLVLVDFVGVYPVADFMVRPDGTQMDPQHFSPTEEVLVALLAFPFLACLVGFLVAKRRDAALVSAALHAVVAGHQVWKKPIWDALLHPDTAITTEFFIYSHLGWTAMSLIIYTLSYSDDDTAPGKKTPPSPPGDTKIKRV